MMNGVPLVGSMATGFGENMMPTIPSAKTPNMEEASQQFVSMLYSYMFQQMRESGSDEEEGLFSGPHVNMLMGFMDQEIGMKLAKTEGEGLSKSLLRQLQGDAEMAEGGEAAQIQALNTAGNSLRALADDDMSIGSTDEDDDDFGQQMMDELYKLNQPK